MPDGESVPILIKNSSARSDRLDANVWAYRRRIWENALVGLKLRSGNFQRKITMILVTSEQAEVYHGQWKIYSWSFCLLFTFQIIKLAYIIECSPQAGSTGHLSSITVWFLFFNFTFITALLSKKWEEILQRSAQTSGLDEFEIVWFVSSLYDVQCSTLNVCASVCSADSSGHRTIRLTWWSAEGRYIAVFFLNFRSRWSRLNRTGFIKLI